MRRARGGEDDVARPVHLRPGHGQDARGQAIVGGRARQGGGAREIDSLVGSRVHEGREVGPDEVSLGEQLERRGRTVVGVAVGLGPFGAAPYLALRGRALAVGHHHRLAVGAARAGCSLRGGDDQVDPSLVVAVALRAEIEVGGIQPRVSSPVAFVVVVVIVAIAVVAMTVVIVVVLVRVDLHAHRDETGAGGRRVDTQADVHKRVVRGPELRLAHRGNGRVSVLEGMCARLCIGRGCGGRHRGRRGSRRRRAVGRRLRLADGGRRAGRVRDRGRRLGAVGDEQRASDEPAERATDSHRGSLGAKVQQTSRSADTKPPERPRSAETRLGPRLRLLWAGCGLRRNNATSTKTRLTRRAPQEGPQLKEAAFAKSTRIVERSFAELN